MPEGAAAARALACPLDVISISRVPIPRDPEPSCGAIAIDGPSALNLPLVHRLEISAAELELTSGMVREDAEGGTEHTGTNAPRGKNRRTRGRRPGLGIQHARGCAFCQGKNPLAVIVASPVSSDSAHRSLSSETGIDRLIVLVKNTKPVFRIAGFYKDFKPLTDMDVISCPSSASERRQN